MKSIILTVIALALVLSAGLASAALEVKSTTIPTTATHNQDVPITFTLVNTDSVAYTAVTFAESTTSLGTWKTLPPATSIAAGETKTLSAVLNIPAQARGTLTGQLKAKTETNIQATPQSLSIAINNTPAVAITTVKEITNAQNGTISVVNNGNVALTNIALSLSGNAKATFSVNNFALPLGASRSVDVNVIEVTNLAFGDNVITVTAQDAVEASARNVSTFTLRKSFCSSGARGNNLSITDIEIKSSGEDDEDWKLLDEVTVEVEVENTADEEVEDVVVQLGLFDSSGRNMVGKLDFSNEDEEKIELDDIDEDEEETVTFKFRVAGDLDDGNYKLAVKAYSKKSGESNLCTDTSSELDNTVYQQISVDREDDEGRFISFEDIRFSPTEATCGDVVTLSANAFNIGEDDQDRVKLTLKSTDLKVDATQDIRSGLDTGDDEQVTFTFTVPQGLTDKTYTLDLNAEYDYRNGNYREMLDAPHRIPFKVFGCTARPPTQQPNTITISAALESVAQPGNEMIVKTTLKNTASQSVTVLVNAKQHESWAKLTDISQRIVTLAPGESKDVQLTFDVNKDATGEKSFTIEATANDKVQTQQVAVTLEENTSSLWNTLSKNKLAWIIGLVNLVLIIIIIIVAIKISQR